MASEKGTAKGYSRSPRKGEIKFYLALLDEPEREVNDYYLRKNFNLSPDTISRHFALMEANGYLRCRKGRRSLKFFRLTPKGIKHCLKRIGQFPKLRMISYKMRQDIEVYLTKYPSEKFTYVPVDTRVTDADLLKNYPKLARKVFLQRAQLTGKIDDYLAAVELVDSGARQTFLFPELLESFL